MVKEIPENFLYVTKNDLSAKLIRCFNLILIYIV